MKRVLEVRHLAEILRYRVTRGTVVFGGTNHEFDIVRQEMAADLPFFAGVCGGSAFLSSAIPDDTHKMRAACAIRADILERDDGVGIDRYCLAFEFGLAFADTFEQQCSYAATSADYYAALARVHRDTASENDDRGHAVMRARSYIEGRFPMILCGQRT